MSLAIVLLAAVGTYVIPANTTYTLQDPDPHIGAETLVRVEAGALLDLNGRSPSLVGFTGAGVVSNGTATLSLAGGPYRFDGLFNGTLKFAQGETPDAQFGLVIGAKATLQDATVWEPETAVHPLRFARNVGRFRVKAIRFAAGPTLTVEDEAGVPVDLVFGVDNASAGLMAVAGAGNLYADGGFSLTATSDLSAFAGRFGIWRGRVYQGGFAFPATLKEFVIDRTLEPCSLASTDPITRFQFDNTATPLVFDADIFIRKDPGAGNYPMIDLDRPIDFRGQLRIAHANLATGANGTNFVFRRGYASAVNTGALKGRFELRSGFQFGNLAVNTWGNDGTLVKTIIPGGFALSGAGSVIDVYGGAHYAHTMYRGAEKLYGRPGAILTLSDRYGRSCAAGTELRMDGCTLRLCKHTYSFSQIVLNDDNANLRASVGARPVRIYADMNNGNLFQYPWTFPEKTPLVTEPGLARDGGVDFYGSAAINIQAPWTISGPFRITDGRVIFTGSATNKAATSPISGSGDVELVNAALGTFDGGRIADGSRIVYEGAATVEVRSERESVTKTVTVGRAGAAKDASLVRRGRGVLIFGDNRCVGKSTHTYDTANVKAYVNGGLATQANGRIPMPVFTACYPQTQYTTIDFATIDANNLVSSFAGYTDDDFTQGASAVVRVTANATLTANATVAGLNVRRASLTIAEGKTLAIANGSYPSVLIGNNNSQGQALYGPGTLDFGGHEGLVMLGQKGYGSGPFIIGAKITGSGGVTFAGSRVGHGAGVRLTNANTYTGGTWVNCAIAYVRNDRALSTGDVRLGNGRVCGGRLDFDAEGITIANRVTGGGFGPYHNFTDTDGTASMIRFNYANCCLAGPLEVTDKGRILLATENGATDALISGVVSGGRLQFWSSAGIYRLTGTNVHTGGTEVVRSTLAVPRANALGSGDVMLDGGTLRFENDAPITVANRIWGVGTIQLAGAAVDFTGIDGDPNIDDLTLDVAGGARAVNRIDPFNAITNTAVTVGSLSVTEPGVNVFTGAYDARVALSAEPGVVIDFGCRDMGALKVGGAGTFRRGALTLDCDIEPGGPGAVGTLRFDPTPTFGPNARLVAEVGRTGVDCLVTADDADISSLPVVFRRLSDDVCRKIGTVFESEGTLTGPFGSVTTPRRGSWTLDYLGNLVRLNYTTDGLLFILR